MSVSSDQPRESDYRRIVGIVMLAIAVISVGVNLFVPPLYNVDAQPPVGAAQTANAAASTLGGMTSPMGLALLIVAVAMIIVGLGLLAHQRWDMIAMMTLGADIVLRIANGIGQFVTGATLLSTLLLPVTLAIIDVALIWYAFRAWNKHRHYVKEFD
jgi:hypothetical protein